MDMEKVRNGLIAFIVVVVLTAGFVVADSIWWEDGTPRSYALSSMKYENEVQNTLLDQDIVDVESMSLIQEAVDSMEKRCETLVTIYFYEDPILPRAIECKCSLRYNNQACRDILQSKLKMYVYDTLKDHQYKNCTVSKVTAKWEGPKHFGSALLGKEEKTVFFDNKPLAE